MLARAARRDRAVTLPLLAARHLSKSFVATRTLLGRPLRHVRAVDDVSFHIARGETLALVGESGCGKSTLGRLVMRLVEPTEGTIEIAGQPVTGLSERALHEVRRRVQLIFQDPYSALNPRMTAGQIIAEPLMLHGLRPRAERPGRVAELLSSVGLVPAHAERYPHEFSGGQRQRVMIARTLAAEPELIVCDEPVSALDMSVQSQILNLLTALQNRLGLSYYFISHDLAVVRHIADRVAVMYLGRIVETGAAEAVFTAARHPYTRALIAAAPIPDPRARRLTSPIEGDLPNPLEPPSGCHFHTRCPFAQPVCCSERPELVDGGVPGHPAACHFRDTLPAADPVRAPQPGNVRLDKLLAAFRAGSTAGEAA